MRIYHPKPKLSALWREIGLPASCGAVKIDSIKTGFSVDVIDIIHIWAGMPKSEILRATGVSSCSLTRRRTNDDRYTPEESKRINRFLRVMDATVDLFGGDKSKVITWMSSHIKGLGHQTPHSLMETETAALVATTMGIVYGCDWEIKMGQRILQRHQISISCHLNK